jgi:hypothetical protein
MKILRAADAFCGRRREAHVALSKMDHWPSQRRYKATLSFRRRAVRWAISEKEYPQRRACGFVALHPKTDRYASTRRTTALCGQAEGVGFATTEGYRAPNHAHELSDGTAARLWEGENCHRRENGCRGIE